MTDTCENKTSIDISDVSRNLAEHVMALAALTEQVNDTHSTFVLHNLEPHLRSGLVRIAVVGITGSGKSTLVNALTEHLILPENPSISSPIPVWIGYGEGETDAVEVYLNDKGNLTREDCDTLTFRKKYCYNLRDILDRDRTRYNNTEFGMATVQADVLRGNVTLIDTLGIAANSVDSRKTIRVLQEGVDAVLFVTKNAQLNEEEVRFINRYILGCTDDPECNKNRISAKNLLFVHNAFYGFPSKVAFEGRIRTVLEQPALKLTAEEIDECLANNIFYVNAYDERLGKLGAYPYVESAPEGSDEEDMDAFAELEEKEQWQRESTGADKLIAGSGMDILRLAIAGVGRRLGQGNGETNVSAKRVRDLLCIVDGIMQTANLRIQAQNLTVQQLLQQEQTFAAHEKADKTTQDDIRAAFKSLGKDYKEGFNSLMKIITDDTLRQVCVGYAQRLAAPQKFQTDYADIVKMTDNQRADYLEKYILDDVIRNIYINCATELIRELDERRTNQFKTPFAVIAETKKCMDDQAVILNSTVQALKDAGGDALGMFFPQPLVVENLIQSLKLDLEDKIKGIIADACRLSGNDYINKHRNILQQCRLNLLQNVIGLFLPGSRADMLWNKIRNQILDPLANAIVDDMQNFTVVQILEETIDAYNTSCNAICDRHTELFISLKYALNTLRQQVAKANQNATVTESEMLALKEKCKQIRSEIMDMLVTLTSGGKS